MIRASELGEYEYCARAWWYRHVVKLPIPEGRGQSRLEAGTRAHERHGRRVAAGSRLGRAGLLLLLLGFLALGLAALLTFAR